MQFYRACWLNHLIFMSLLAWTGVAHALSINLYVREPFRSGHGDPGASWLAVRQLKAEHPDWQIRVLYTDESSKGLNLFYPAMKTELQKQTFSGVEWLNLSKNAAVPESDFLLQMSSVLYDHVESSAIPLEVLGKSKVALRFEELGMHLKDIEAYALYVDQLKNPNVKIPVAHFETGLGKKAAIPGFYVSARPPKSIPRADLLDELAKQGLHIKSGELYAFGYSSLIYQEEGYLNPALYYYGETIAEMAKLPQYRDKKIHLIVNHDFRENFPPRMQVKLPKNVEVHLYRSFPSETFDQLLIHSDLPVLVTGDCSLSQALDAEAPFLYEMKGWKEELPKQLRMQVFQGMKPEYKKMIEEIWSLPARHTEGVRLPRAQIKRWASLLARPEFKNEFKAMIGTHRAKLSFFRNLSERLLQIEKAGFPPLKAGDLRDFERIFKNPSRKANRMIGMTDMTPKAAIQNCLLDVFPPQMIEHLRNSGRLDE